MASSSRDSSRHSRNASRSPTSSNSSSSSPPSSWRMSSQPRFRANPLADASIVPGRIAYLKDDFATKTRITDLTTGKAPEKDITGHPIMVISRPESDTKSIHFIVTTSFNGAHISERPDILRYAKYYIPHSKPGPGYIKHPLHEEGNENYRPIQLEKGGLFDKNCYFSLRGIYSVEWKGSLLPYHGIERSLATELISPDGIRRLSNIANELYQYIPGKQYTPPPTPPTRMSSSPVGIENRCNSIDWRNSRKDSGLSASKLSEFPLRTASNGRTKTIGSGKSSQRPLSWSGVMRRRSNSDDCRTEGSSTSDDSSADQARKQKRAEIAAASSWR